MIISHLSQIAVILAAETSLTITSWPNDVPIGYVLFPDPNFENDEKFLDHEQFHLYIKSTSLANLETAIGLFNNVDSLLPGGYKFSTAGQPIHIDMTRLTKDPEGFSSLFQVKGKWVN